MNLPVLRPENGSQPIADVLIQHNVTCTALNPWAGPSANTSAGDRFPGASLELGHAPRHAKTACQRARVAMGVAAMLCTGWVGAATTIQTVVDSDHLACRRLLDMVKAAGVLTMTDAQLCDFRFARLPPAMTKGFTFPRWEEISVSDPTAMYFRLRTANVVPRSPATSSSPWPSYMKAVGQAVNDNNLAFYKTDLQLEGKGASVTFVQMDIKKCSGFPPYVKEIAAPFYAIFDHSNFQHPEPVSNAPESEQVALWKNHIPIQLSIWPYWSSLSADDPTSLIQVTMEGLARSSVDGPFYGAIHAYSVCAFNIRRTKSVKRLAERAAVAECKLDCLL